MSQIGNGDTAWGLHTPKIDVLSTWSSNGTGRPIFLFAKKGDHTTVLMKYYVNIETLNTDYANMKYYFNTIRKCWKNKTGLANRAEQSTWLAGVYKNT